ncbi:hypothetical protein [Nocardia sp. X0981]
MDTATADVDSGTPTPTSGPLHSGSRPTDRSTLVGGTTPADPRILPASTPTEAETTNTLVKGRTTDKPGTTSTTDKPGTTSTTDKPGTTSTTESETRSADPASSGMQVLANSGPTKPYHQVNLEELPNNPELNLFITQAERAMQQSVDVLGFGRSDPPPPPKNGKTPDKVQAAALPGSGMGVELYKQQVLSAGARQDSMVDMDAQVDGTSQMVAAEQAQALFSIVHVEAELNAALRTVKPKKLKPAEEAKVMDHVAAAVTKVHDIVQAAQNVNVDAAGGGSSGGGSGGSGGGAPAGGGAGAANGMGGLGSMLPMLAMLPMMAMPLLSQLPELLEQKDENEDGEKDEAPPSQPAPSPGPAPAPTDPTKPEPEGAAPTPGESPPPNQNPQPEAPQTEIPYGPTPPSKQV